MDFPISEDGHWVDLEAHLNALDFQGRRIKAAHKSRSTADVDHAKQRKVLALKRKQSKSVPHWTDDPNPDAPKTKLAKIQTLPYDIKHQIMKNLDFTTSTCLGLTCRDFYNVHWKIHGPVGLMPPKPFYIKGPFNPAPDQLPRLLSFWMEWNFGLKYRMEIEKFLTVKRWVEMDEKDYGRYGLEQRFFNSEVGSDCANWEDWALSAPRPSEIYSSSEAMHGALTGEWGGSKIWGL